MRYQIYKDTVGLWRWRLVAANNQIIASGESYYNKEDCLHVVNLVRGSGNSPIYEV